MNNPITAAIQETIRSAGFLTMADEYKSRPEHRAQIETVVIRYLRRNERVYGADAAQRFKNLLAAAKKAA